MSILWTLIVGLVVGAVAKLLLPGRDPGGLVVTALIGVAGAFIASFVGQEMGWYQAGEPAGILGSILGAMLLLLGIRVAMDRRSLL